MDKVERIIARLKAGEIDEAEAQRLLDEDMHETDFYRLRRELPVGLLIEDDVEVPDVTEGEVLRRETINALLRVINGLPKRQAQCVELYFFDQLTQVEIAARLGIRQDNVSRHIAWALQNLARTATTDCIFRPTTALTSEGIFVSDLMRQPHHKSKHSRLMRFPFEMWQRWCVGAGWSGNNVYAARYENRLREYLSDCFGGDPPLVGWYTFRARR